MINLRRAGLLLGICFAVAARAETSALVLVEEGRGRAIIVLADRPTAAAKAGAELLAAQLERVSGARLPVVDEGALSDARVVGGRVQGSFKGRVVDAWVLVGESELARRLGVTAEGLGPGGVRLLLAGNALVLLGPDDATPSDPDGTRYAVITFLEEALGFRMLWPGELGLVAPPRWTVDVAPLDVALTPAIGQRRIRNSHYNDRVQAGLDYLGLAKAEQDKVEAVTLGGDSKLPNWFAWQRLGGDAGISAGHAFGYAWERYHAAHPDWFAMQPNGSRDLSQLTPERARLCKSNVALIDALAADKVEEMTRSGKHAASLCPNDGGKATFCMCPTCKRLDSPEGRSVVLLDNSSGTRRAFDYVSLTDRMVWFWNGLAERITAKVPDARLGVYAYSCYKAPPVRMKLHPSLAVGFVGMSYASDAERLQALEDWEAWSKATGTLYWRPNLLLLARREGVPALYVHKLGEDLARFARHSLKGADFDSCCHNWATEGLNYYVLARLLWKPDAKVDAILDDYCKSGFGQGWTHVRRYFDRIETLTDAVAAHASPVTSPYTPETVAELGALLEAARQADVDETVRRRVAFLRYGLDFAALQQQAYAFLAAHADKALSAADKAQIMALQQAKWTFMHTFFQEEPLAINMPMVAWGGEGNFRKYGWKGAAGALPKAKTEADEEGKE
jgi:hypothetical protein